MDINEDYYNPDSLDILRSSHDVDVRLAWQHSRNVFQ